jgi:hypothetical protein
MNRKGHTKRRHSKKTARRRTLKGGYYSFSGAVGTGAPSWTRHSEMGDWAVSNRGANAQYGSGRRRKSMKGAKGKKHRGGSRFGAVSASYQGTGSRGIADYVPTNTKVPPFGPAPLGAFNNAGAQPGSGFGSFIKAH